MCYKRSTAKWVRSFREITFAALAFVLTTSAVQAETLVFHASESGKQTLDQGEDGGNPFASALIEIMEWPSLTLSLLPKALRELTIQKSRRFQSADVPATVPQGNFVLIPAKKGERRIALVMVVSDYDQSGGAQSLPGARNDAMRIAAALRAAKFNTEMALDLGLRAMREKLLEFASRTINSDAAVI